MPQLALVPAYRLNRANTSGQSWEIYQIVPNHKSELDGHWGNHKVTESLRLNLAKQIKACAFVDLAPETGSSASARFPVCSAAWHTSHGTEFRFYFPC